MLRYAGVYEVIKDEKYHQKCLARFYSKCDRSAPNDCWHWLDSLNGSGYGYFSFKGPKEVGYCIIVGAHVASLILHGIKIPKNFEAHHKCQTRDCVNPDHIIPVRWTANRKTRQKIDMPDFVLAIK